MNTQQTQNTPDNRDQERENIRNFLDDVEDSANRNNIDGYLNTPDSAISSAIGFFMQGVTCLLDVRDAFYNFKPDFENRTAFDRLTQRVITSDVDEQEDDNQEVLSTVDEQVIERFIDDLINAVLPSSKEISLPNPEEEQNKPFVNQNFTREEKIAILQDAERQFVIRHPERFFNNIQTKEGYKPYRARNGYDIESDFNTMVGVFGEETLKQQLVVIKNFRASNSSD